MMKLAGCHCFCMSHHPHQLGFMRGRDVRMGIRAVHPAPGSLSGVPRTLLSATLVLQSLGRWRLHLGCWTWGPISATPPPHTARLLVHSSRSVLGTEVGSGADRSPGRPRVLSSRLLTRVPRSCSVPCWNSRPASPR